MSNELTPAQQSLLNFLDKLATSDYSPELMQEGYQVLDAAVIENRRLQDTIHRCENAMRSARQTVKLDGGQR